MHRIPSANTHQHSVGMFDGIYMAIMLFAHFDRRAHLLGEQIDIHACGKPERRIGMAEAISGARNAARPVTQTGIFQQLLNGVAVKPDCRFAIDDGEYRIVGLVDLDCARTRSRYSPTLLGAMSWRVLPLPWT